MASRWAVARESPVASTSSARRARPPAPLEQQTDLSRTPTPLTMCSTSRDLISIIETQVRLEPDGRPGGRRPWPQPGPSPRRSGTATSSARPTASPTCSTSTCTSSTRSPRPQAFDGLRLDGRGVRRPDLTVATDGPQRARPTDPRSADRRPDLAPSRWRCSRANCAEFGIRCYAMGDPGPGHRARHRPEQGLTQPGHDDRLRRQPHLHPRRLRGAGVRHRHQRGRARARHPDAAPARARHHGGHRRGRPARRRHRQGRHPRRSSAASAPAAASARSSSTAARPSGPCRWRAA